MSNSSNLTKNLLRNENFHKLILIAFKVGKFSIIYGSIFFLTVLGIITWIFGVFNLFSLIWKSIEEWVFCHETAASALQHLQANAIVLLDVFLLSVVLFIVAIGLYGIFIWREKGGIKLPVRINKISELERYLFGTIVAILLVAALNRILSPETPIPDESITAIGMTCAIILVISVYLAVQHSEEKQENGQS